MARTPDHESRTSGSVARAEMAPRTKKRSSFGAIASAVMLSISLVGCGIGGVMLAIKGEKAAEEVEDSKARLHSLHAQVINQIKTPTNTIVVMEKMRKTPAKYFL